MRVLITAPSLDEMENVSGISTMMSYIIEYFPCEFIHFQAGRKDGDSFDLGWFITQAKLPFVFRRALRRSKPDLIHINTAFEPRSIIRDLVLAKSAGKRPVILHLHGGRYLMQDTATGLLGSAITHLLRSASRIIVLSEAERERVLSLTPGVDVVVLPNAIATEKFPDHEREWGRTKNILYFGRLVEAKGLGDMLEASRQLVAQGFKFRFSCCGAGSEREKFIADMTEVLGTNFQYGGVVSGDDKRRVLEDADVFLMPSLFEGIPVALLEAMAAGCVPVVSNRGSVPSVIEDGRNGFMVDPGDLTQIVGRLKFLLSEGDPGWEDYRRSARETVRQRFDLVEYTKQLSTIYTEVSQRT